jgi:desulfoferrodoxin (superoxide reductase-like protein)
MPELIAVLPTHDRTVATSKTVHNNKVTIVPFVMQTQRFINWIYLRHNL